MSLRKPAEIDEYGALLCPHCNDNYLHHGNVTVYQRKEDEDWTTVIAQDNADAVVTRFPSSDTPNPSSRRNSLTIEFECEHCSWDKPPKVLRLAIIQHKGNTFMEWL